MVVNCAAFTQVDDCETQPRRGLGGQRDRRRATWRPRRAQDGARLRPGLDRLRLRRPGRRRPTRSMQPTAPISVYGAASCEGEREVLASSGTAVVRTSLAVRARAARISSPRIRGQIEKRAGTTRRRCGWSTTRSGGPTYTRFLAARSCGTGRGRGRRASYHYCNREPVSWHGFAREIVRGAGSRRSRSSGDDRGVSAARPPRPAYSVLDVSAFRESRRARRSSLGYAG